MKRSALFLLFFFLVVIYSCNQTPPAASGGGVATSQCYTSTAGADSASLIVTTQYGRVTGGLKMYFDGKDNMSGSISGKFTGDTLMIDYTYKLGDNPQDFRNPLVFLKKGGKLYQGYGQTETAYGRTGFKRGAPIDFTKGFVFIEGDCR